MTSMVTMDTGTPTLASSRTKRWRNAMLVCTVTGLWVRTRSWVRQPLRV